MLRLGSRYKKILFTAVLLMTLPAVVRFVSTTFNDPPPTVQAQGKQRFTIHLNEIHRVGTDGNRPGKIARQIIVAVRGDGARSVTEIYFPGQPQEHRVRLVRLSDFTHVRAMDSVALKTTQPPWPAHAILSEQQGKPTPESACKLSGVGKPAFPAYTFAGEQAIGGLQAMKFVRGKRDTEAWHAPDLGCEEIRRVILFESCCTADGGRIASSSELTMTSYSRAEPDPSLFDVASLREVSPIEANEALLRKAGYPEEHIQQRLRDLQAADVRYRSTQQR